MDLLHLQQQSRGTPDVTGWLWRRRSAAWAPRPADGLFPPHLPFPPSLALPLIYCTEQLSMCCCIHSCNSPAFFLDLNPLFQSTAAAESALTAQQQKGNRGNICSSLPTCFPERGSPSPLCSVSSPAATCRLMYTTAWSLSPGSLTQPEYFRR